MKRWRLVLLFVLPLLAYRLLPSQFFIQDEWHNLGQEYVWHAVGAITFFIHDALSPVGIRFLPFLYLANFIQFSFFKQNAMGYALVSLGLHLVNTLLVFIVVRDLHLCDSLKVDKRFAFLTAALFAVAATQEQAVTWLIQHSSTLPALTFSLIAIHFWLKSRWKWGIFFLLVAICFKETAFFLFPFLFLIFFLYGKKKYQGWRDFLPVIGLTVIGVIYAGSLLVFAAGHPSPEREIFLPHTGFFQTVAGRILTIPARAICQSFFPESVLVWISRQIASLPVILNSVILPAGSPQYSLFAETVVGKNLMYAFAFVVVVLACIFFRKNKKLLLIGFSFIVFGSLPLFLISTIAGDFTYIESRYLYIICIGSNLMLGWISLKLIGRFKFMGWVVFAVLIISNILIVNTILSGQVDLGSQRKHILTAISQARPILPQKVVFLFESDRAYYGLPPREYMPPFQSGFGQTLMVWYQPIEKFPVGFYNDNFLWDIESQGYKEVGGRGFGYFRDFFDLAKSVKENNLLFDDVISFSYNSNTNSVTDNTEEVRGRLLGYSTPKRKVEINKNSLFSDRQVNDLGLLIDNNRDTYWNSKLPYSNSQYIEIDLKTERKVTEVDIDVNHNLDQNQVGYEILLSTDGKTWRSVYKKARVLYNQDGIAKLYFEPTFSRFVKISQIGYHKYANWVIAELGVYESAD